MVARINQRAPEVAFRGIPGNEKSCSDRGFLTSNAAVFTDSQILELYCMKPDVTWFPVSGDSGFRQPYPSFQQLLRTLQPSEFVYAFGVERTYVVQISLKTLVKFPPTIFSTAPAG